MPTLNIIEYGNNSSDNTIGDFVAIQNIEFDESGPVLSNPFSYKTSSVRFASTANCWLKFTSTSENDVSDENGIFLFSSNPQRFRVEPLQRISILQGEASAGTGGGDIDLSDAYQAEYTGDWIIQQALLASTSVQPAEIESISIVAGAIETPLDGNHRTLVLSEDVDSGWSAVIDGDPSSQVFYSSVDIFPPESGGPFMISIPVEWICMGPLDTISLGAGDDPITVTLRSWGVDNIAYTAVQGGDAVV
jgi:hypothetical protein